MEQVDLRSNDRRNKELRRIANTVRQIAKRDFGEPIVVVIHADPEEEPAVLIGAESES